MKAPCRRAITAELAAQDAQAVTQWNLTISTMREAVTPWARQSKHAAPAYALLMQLLCCSDDASFLQHLGAVMEALHKQLRAETSVLHYMNPLSSEAGKAQGKVRMGFKGALSHWIVDGALDGKMAAARRGSAFVEREGKHTPSAASVGIRPVEGGLSP